MELYLVKRKLTKKDTGESNIEYCGRQDVIFLDGIHFTASDYYSVRRYGYATIPAAKRSLAYRNRHNPWCYYIVEDVEIVSVAFDSGRVIITPVAQ